MEQPYIDVLMEIGEALRENNELLGRIAKALEGKIDVDGD